MVGPVARAALLLLALLPVVLGAAGRAGSQEIMRIAAVVNNEAISIPDLVARIDVAIAVSRLQASDELRQRLAPQVLRALIDERLKVQEATRLGVTVSEAELADAQGTVEQRNGIPAGDFERFLRSQGLAVAVVLDQIRAEIMWSKLVRGRLGASVSVGEGEIDEAIAKLEANRGRPEYRVAEIFLAAESSDRESEARAAAASLYEQLAAGASFGQIARQFSQSATAAVGGDIGWVVEGQLPSEIEAVLARLEPGSVAPPVRAFDGYYIISLIDRRTVLAAETPGGSVHLAQLVLAADRVEIARADGTLERLRDQTEGCEALLAHAGEIGTALSGDLGRVAIGDLPPAIRAVVDDAPVGRASEPLPYDGGVRIVMVCEREDAALASPDREAIRREIAGRRLELMARRYVRDLHRSAFIDIRI